MKMRRALLLLPAAWALCGPGFARAGERRLTEKQALDDLVSRIRADKVYASWTALRCLLFTTESATDSDFDFAVLEKHGDGCPGDPDTMPVVDRFRVDRRTGVIRWYDVVMDAYRPYQSFLESRGKN